MELLQYDKQSTEERNQRLAEHYKNLGTASLEQNEIWRELPVSSKVFFETYLNEPCFPEQQKFIDNILGENPYEWNTRYQEAVALVGKGGGKDRTIAKLLVYLCYKIQCLKSPQQFFKQPEGDNIDIVNMCLNARLAKKVFFKYFTSMIKKCRVPAIEGQRDIDRINWFVSHGLDLKKDILDREVVFPGNITCHSLDSTDYSFEGLNVLVVVFDEVGGFIPTKAKEIYDAVTDTQNSRYGDLRKTVLLSFPRDKNDFMMIRYKEAETEPTTFRVRAATWEWNLRRKKEDFKDKYIKNPESAKRVFECLVDVSEGGYFKYKEQLEYILKNTTAFNPIINEYVIVKSLKVLQFQPWFVPDTSAVYFIHVDTAKGKEGGDAAGFCMGHYVPKMKTNISDEHIKKLFLLEGIDLAPYKGVESLGVKIDLYFQLKAPRGGEIIFDDILELIVNLKRGLHFNIKKATFDGYQSLSLIQNLKKHGIESEELSVDRSTEAYDSLKNIIYKGVLETYPNLVALRELDELLVTDKGKIDHPAESFRRSAEEGDKRGSKDVADAMAGVVYNCLKELPADAVLWFANTRQGNFAAPQDKIRIAEQEKLVRYGQRPV